MSTGRKNLKQIIKNIFSVRNENIRKVVTILGIKFKFKSSKLIADKRIKKLENKIKNCENKIKNCELKSNEQIQSLQDRLNTLDEKFESFKNKAKYLTPESVSGITEIAMLKTKYKWDDIHIPKIKNNFETLEALINTNKSIIRFGDGDFGLMEGRRICFQDYNPNLAKALREIFEEPSEDLLIGIPEPYYAYPLELRDHSKRFIFKWFPVWHKIIEKYCKGNRTYYSTQISQVFPEYKTYDYEEHYSKLKSIWDSKRIAIITGDRVFNPIEYNIFENARDITYIYGPTVNAFDEYENIKEKIIDSVPKDTTLVFALGPTGKIIAYDLFKKGYRVLDLGHVIKDYDFYKKSSAMTKEEWEKCREKFFSKD